MKKPTVKAKNEEFLLTAEGAARLKAELEELTGTARKALAHRLRNAIQMGDLSENAEYHKAKEDQSFLEGRIQELEHILRNVVIIESTSAARDYVSVGSRVTVQEAGQPPETYLLVGAKEADPQNGKISNESPIGKALLDRRIGEEVEINTPAGGLHLRILKIE